MAQTETDKKALAYHAAHPAGKLCIQSTKSTLTQEDLSLAYTPGVGAPVLEIARDPGLAYTYTNKGNLVAVISNGTAILGFGNLGALASKPVMEGKAVLFKRFANVDVYDIELDCHAIENVVEVVAAMAPTFGGINLEDIKAPECFRIEEELIRRLDIPVFHDDQHGTAIIIAAGLLNAVELQGKSKESVRIVCVGAGAAGIASMKLLAHLGFSKDNIMMVDTAGVIHDQRTDLNEYKEFFAVRTKRRTLADAMKEADVFIGVSGPNILDEAMVLSMAPKPIIFALSNPTPEVSPALVARLRPDAVMATGRSDYPNQINNVLCFPYMFRGALDARATKINIEMHMAAVYALRDLAREPVTEEVLAVYKNEPDLVKGFGPQYIIPKPFDSRLKKVSLAVEQAAIKSGVIRADKV